MDKLHRRYKKLRNNKDCTNKIGSLEYNRYKRYPGQRNAGLLGVDELQLAEDGSAMETVEQPDAVDNFDHTQIIPINRRMIT